MSAHACVAVATTQRIALTLLYFQVAGLRCGFHSLSDLVRRLSYKLSAKLAFRGAPPQQSGASGQWLSRFPPRDRNVDEQFRSITEIASATARSRGWFAHHRVDLHPRD